MACQWHGIERRIENTDRERDNKKIKRERERIEAWERENSERKRRKEGRG